MVRIGEPFLGSMESEKTSSYDFLSCFGPLLMHPCHSTSICEQFIHKQRRVKNKNTIFCKIGALLPF